MLIANQNEAGKVTVVEVFGYLGEDVLGG